MKVRLKCVLAEYLDGIDVRNRRAGDVLDLPEPEAQLLIAEKWAIEERRERNLPPPDRERRNTADGSDDPSREG